MPRNVVLTGVGRDRVGIVARVSQVLYELGCNLLDSSMTLLRGEFAIILMLAVPDSASPGQLKEKIEALGAELGLNFHLRELAADELLDAEPGGHAHMISVYGADKPGIVAGFTQKLAELGVNITDVQTKATGSGSDMLYVMLLEVVRPDELAAGTLEAALKDEASRLGVDATLQAIEVYEL